MTTQWKTVPCDTSACVEVARVQSDIYDFALRSTQDKDVVVLLSSEEMRNFVMAVKSGWLDEVL